MGQLQQILKSERRHLSRNSGYIIACRIIRNSTHDCYIKAITVSNKLSNKFSGVNVMKYVKCQGEWILWKIFSALTVLCRSIKPFTLQLLTESHTLMTHIRRNVGLTWTLEDPTTPLSYSPPGQMWVVFITGNDSIPLMNQARLSKDPPAPPASHLFLKQADRKIIARNHRNRLKERKEIMGKIVESWSRMQSDWSTNSRMFFQKTSDLPTLQPRPPRWLFYDQMWNCKKPLLTQSVWLSDSNTRAEPWKGLSRKFITDWLKRKQRQRFIQHDSFSDSFNSIHMSLVTASL